MTRWIRVSVLFLASALSTIALRGLPEDPNESEPVLALMTDDCVVQIDQAPDVVWAHLKRLYVDGDRYRQMGHDVTPITGDPSAFLGGFRAVSKEGSAEARIDISVRHSIVDDENRFMAMHMDGMLPRGIYVSHDASPSGEGTRYQVIIHAFMEVEREGDNPDTVESVREWMTARRSEHQKGLEEIVKREIVAPLESR